MRSVGHSCRSLSMACSYSDGHRVAGSSRNSYYPGLGTRITMIAARFIERLPLCQALGSTPHQGQHPWGRPQSPAHLTPKAPAATSPWHCLSCLPGGLPSLLLTVVVAGAVAVIAIGRVVVAAIAGPVALLVAVALVPVVAVALIPTLTLTCGGSRAQGPMDHLAHAGARMEEILPCG